MIICKKCMDEDVDVKTYCGRCNDLVCDHHILDEDQKPVYYKCHCCGIKEYETFYLCTLCVVEERIRNKL